MPKAYESESSDSDSDFVKKKRQRKPRKKKLGRAPRKIIPLKKADKKSKNFTSLGKPPSVSLRFSLLCAG
jgi:hypothetical protein